MPHEQILSMMVYAQLLHRCGVKSITVYDIPVHELRMSP